MARCRLFFQNLKDTVKSRSFQLKTAGVLFQTSLFVLDYVCQEKVENGEVKWGALSGYMFNSIEIFNSTQLLNRIALVFMLMSSLSSVINKVKEDSHRVKKVVPFAAGFAYTFANEALTIGFTSTNYPFTVTIAAVEGLQLGTLLTALNYSLDEHNYSLLPVVKGHFAAISAGVIIAGIQNFLNLITKQMMKQGFLEWDALTSPALAFDTAIQSAIYSMITFYNIKYSEDLNFKKDLCFGLFMSIYNVINFWFNGVFTKENAGYLIGNSFVNGMPVGGFTRQALSLSKSQTDEQRQQQSALVRNSVVRAQPQTPLLAGTTVEERRDNTYTPV